MRTDRLQLWGCAKLKWLSYQAVTAISSCIQIPPGVSHLALGVYDSALRCRQRDSSPAASPTATPDVSPRAQRMSLRKRGNSGGTPYAASPLGRPGKSRRRSLAHDAAEALKTVVTQPSEPVISAQVSLACPTTSASGNLGDDHCSDQAAILCLAAALESDSAT